MIKICAVCKESFNDSTRAKCCSAECSRIHIRERRRKAQIGHPEKARARACRYRAGHQEELRDLRRIYCASHREQEREYRVNHREKERAAQRTYYLTHQERQRDKNRKWLRTARGKAFVAARGHNRRSALIGISMTLDTVLELKSEYSGICPYCNQPIVKGHIDHIVPVCKGGTNDRENLVWVCRDCNLKKNNKGLLEFLLSR